jgi:hypothetical protein
MPSLSTPRPAMSAFAASYGSIAALANPSHAASTAHRPGWLPKARHCLLQAPSNSALTLLVSSGLTFAGWLRSWTFGAASLAGMSQLHPSIGHQEMKRFLEVGGSIVRTTDAVLSVLPWSMITHATQPDFSPGEKSGCELWLQCVAWAASRIAVHALPRGGADRRLEIADLHVACRPSRLPLGDSLPAAARFIQASAISRWSALSNSLRALLARFLLSLTCLITAFLFIVVIPAFPQRSNYARRKRFRGGRQD